MNLDIVYIQIYMYKGWISTVTLKPHTGRTHQLRKHMDMLKHPILGDPDYWYICIPNIHFIFVYISTYMISTYISERTLVRTSYLGGS